MQISYSVFNIKTRECEPQCSGGLSRGRHIELKCSDDNIRAYTKALK